VRLVPRLALRNAVAGLCMCLVTHAVAQSESNPPELTAVGLQTCEISEIDPMVTRIHGATKSLSIGVAKDCAHYDPKNPTVVNVHQFTDQQRRDAMVVALQDLRFKALRPYANVWAVESFVIILLGPQRDEIEALIKAEYERRRAAGG
jgi:hypothetical protein